MTPRLLAELASLLAGPPEAAEIALERQLAELLAPPPVAELLALGARARRTGATREELLLAVGTLCALYAPRAPAPGANR